MELICPSCEARYAVPDDAIGEKGRQVSCSNCGHGWHATPPLVLRAATAGARAAGSARGRNDGEVATAEVHRLRPTEGSRSAQLAEIRQMIAQVQTDDSARTADPEETRLATAADSGRESGQQAGAAAAAPAAAAGAMARPRPESRPAGETEESGAYQDPLRRRMAEHDARAAREREERERLRRSMHRHEADRGTGSGAFLTGFLLVGLVAAALLGAYVLAPEIIARLPESEPVMTEYVGFVNELRRGVADVWEAVRAWVLDLSQR